MLKLTSYKAGSHKNLASAEQAHKAYIHFRDSIIMLVAHLEWSCTCHGNLPQSPPVSLGSTFSPDWCWRKLLPFFHKQIQCVYMLSMHVIPELQTNHVVGFSWRCRNCWTIQDSGVIRRLPRCFDIHVITCTKQNKFMKRLAHPWWLVIYNTVLFNLEHALSYMV